jgi:DNA-damage-inducible protein J
VSSDDVVRARIEREIKDRVVAVLEPLGLTLSDVIREVLVRIARDGALPFPVPGPGLRDGRARKRGRPGAGPSGGEGAGGGPEGAPKAP